MTLLALGGILQATTVSASVTTATFGTTTVGGLSATLYYLTPRATQYTPGSSGTVTDIMLYLTGTGHAQVAIYADSGNAPGALLAKSSSDAISSNGWHDFSGFNVAVTGGVPYWLAAEADGPNLRWYYNNGGANLCAGGGGFSYGTFPNPYIRSSSGSYMTSIYAIYAAQSSAPSATFANNLLPILSGWDTYDAHPSSFTLNAHFDANALFNGEASIRIDPHTASDTNIAREVDDYARIGSSNSAPISVTAGDHIVFTCWIKTTSSQNPAGNNNPHGGGARLGIDITAGNVNAMCAVSNGLLMSNGGPVPGYPLGKFDGSFIYWNTPTWTEQTIDFVVPSGYGITSIIPWMQVVGTTDTGLAWFANSALYVNP